MRRREGRPILSITPSAGTPRKAPEQATAKELRGCDPLARARGTLIFRASLVQTREPTPCTCRPRWRGPGPRRVSEETQPNHSKTNTETHANRYFPADNICGDDCTEVLTLGVQRSASGYFLGYRCNECGPHSRVSAYTKDEALAKARLELTRDPRRWAVWGT